MFPERRSSRSSGQAFPSLLGRQWSSHPPSGRFIICLPGPGRGPLGSFLLHGMCFCSIRHPSDGGPSGLCSVVHARVSEVLGEAELDRDLISGFRRHNAAARVWQADFAICLLFETLIRYVVAVREERTWDLGQDVCFSAGKQTKNKKREREQKGFLVCCSMIV